jgi:hypothetical protein
VFAAAWRGVGPAPQLAEALLDQVQFIGVAHENGHRLACRLATREAAVMQRGTSRNIVTNAMALTRSRSRCPASPIEIATATNKGTTKMAVTSSIPAKFRRTSREKDSVSSGCTSTVLP